MEAENEYRVFPERDDEAVDRELREIIIAYHKADVGRKQVVANSPEDALLPNEDAAKSDNADSMKREEPPHSAS